MGARGENAARGSRTTKVTAPSAMTAMMYRRARGGRSLSKTTQVYFWSLQAASSRDTSVQQWRRFRRHESSCTVNDFDTRNMCAPAPATAVARIRTLLLRGRHRGVFRVRQEHHNAHRHCVFGRAASIAAPLPMLPANHASVQYRDQPVTLMVQNAISTQAGVGYTFEVAQDASFGNKVQTKDGVAEGAERVQTSVKLDALAAAKITTGMRARSAAAPRAHSVRPTCSPSVRPSLSGRRYRSLRSPTRRPVRVRLSVSPT